MYMLQLWPFPAHEYLIDCLTTCIFNVQKKVKGKNVASIFSVLFVLLTKYLAGSLEIEL